MIAAAWKVLRVAAKVRAGRAGDRGAAGGRSPGSFLQTRRGGELVRRLALPRVNAALAGQLALGGSRSAAIG